RRFVLSLCLGDFGLFHPPLDCVGRGRGGGKPGSRFKHSSFISGRRRRPDGPVNGGCGLECVGSGCLKAMHIDPWILTFSAVTVLVTIWMGFWSAKKSKTASDFFVAGRSVSVGWNASAI